MSHGFCFSEVMDNKQHMNVPPEILENLRPYKAHIERLCLECGYHGFMGVRKTEEPWYVSLSFLILFAIGLVAYIYFSVWVMFAVVFVTALIIAGLKDGKCKTVTLCPCCKKEISD